MKYIAHYYCGVQANQVQVDFDPDVPIEPDSGSVTHSERDLN